MVPDDIPDAVRDLVEEQFIRMDTQLLQKILSGVEQAQTARDLNFLTMEQDLYGQKVKQEFLNATSTDKAIESSKIHLNNILSGILERQTEGGTLGNYDIQKQYYNSIQTLLQEWYHRDMRDPNIRRDEVITRAESGHYKMTVGNNKYVLSPSHYNADTLGRNTRQENKLIQEEEENKINKINKNSAEYQRLNSGENFKGYDQAYEKLTGIGVKPYQAIKWITEQEVEKRGKDITAIETDIWSQSEFNKGFLSQFTKQGSSVDRFGNKKLISLKGKELADAIKDKYPDAGDDVKWITPAFITRLITAHEAKLQTESLKKLTEKQNTVITNLSNMAIQDLGSAKILNKFYFRNPNKEWEFDYSKVENDKDLISVFGTGKLDQKINAIEKLGRVAMGVHERHIKSIEPKDITDKQHPGILDSIANEYNRNAGPAIARAEQQPKSGREINNPYTEASDQLEEDDLWGHHRSPDAGKSNKLEHILKEDILEEDLKGILKVGQNIINLDTNGLVDAIDYLNDEHPVNSLNKGTRDQVLQAINARQIKLKEDAAFTAIAESGQILIFKAGKPVDVNLIYQWQKQYRAGSIKNLLPKSVLDTVTKLGDTEISAAERFGKYQELQNISKQFGDINTQRIALSELRRKIRKDVDPALAALTDIWGNIDLGRKQELFSIASGKFDATEDPGKQGIIANTYADIKEAISERGKLFGVKSTMQSLEQQSDHTALQRKILESRAGSTFYKDQDPNEIADSLNDELYGKSHVVVTGQRYNFEVDNAPYEAIGLTSEDDALNGYKHYMYEMEFTENPASWTPISGLHPRILEQLRDQALQSSMMTNMQIGVKRYREMKNGEYTGKIIEENINTGETKEIFVDAFTKIQAQSVEQISEDILRANSENLRKGFINSGDGFNIGVYLVGPDGNINQSMLIGKFFQVDERGRKRDIVVSQEELAAYSASPYILNFLNGAKFIINFDHQYIKDLKKEGADKILKGTMAPRISGTPFFRFLEKTGKLEFDHAILPLHSAMEKKAKSLGVELLNRKQSEEILNELIGRQDRWYKTEWMPEFMKPFLGSFTTLRQQTFISDFKERLDPDSKRPHGRKQ